MKSSPDKMNLEPHFITSYKTKSGNIFHFGQMPLWHVVAFQQLHLNTAKDHAFNCRLVLMKILPAKWKKLWMAAVVGECVCFWGVVIRNVRMHKHKPKNRSRQSLIWTAVGGGGALRGEVLSSRSRSMDWPWTHRLDSRAGLGSGPKVIRRWREGFLFVASEHHLAQTNGSRKWICFIQARASKYGSVIKAPQKYLFFISLSAHWEQKFTYFATKWAVLVGISAWISTPSQRFDCGPLVNICNRYHFISPADQSSCSCLVIVLSTNSLSYASSMHLSFRCSLLNRTERSSRFAWFLSYLSSSWQRKGGRKGGHGMRVERCRTVSNSDWPPSHSISFESFFFNSFQIIDISKTNALTFRSYRTIE